MIYARNKVQANEINVLLKKHLADSNLVLEEILFSFDGNSADCLHAPSI